MTEPSASARLRKPVGWSASCPGEWRGKARSPSKPVSRMNSISRGPLAPGRTSVARGWLSRNCPKITAVAQRAHEPDHPAREDLTDVLRSGAGDIGAESQCGAPVPLRGGRSREADDRGRVEDHG